MIKFKPLWGGEEDDLYYIAALIDQLENPLCEYIHFPEEPQGNETEVQEKFSDFTKRLILLNAGLLPKGFDSEFPIPSEVERALPDFVENFKELYPHLFLKRCPRWVHWITETVENLNV